MTTTRPRRLWMSEHNPVKSPNRELRGGSSRGRLACLSSASKSMFVRSIHFNLKNSCPTSLTTSHFPVTRNLRQTLHHRRWPVRRPLSHRVSRLQHNSLPTTPCGKLRAALARGAAIRVQRQSSTLVAVVADVDEAVQGQRMGMW